MAKRVITLITGNKKGKEKKAVTSRKAKTVIIYLTGPEKREVIAKANPL